MILLVVVDSLFEKGSWIEHIGMAVAAEVARKRPNQETSTMKGQIDHTTSVTPLALFYQRLQFAQPARLLNVYLLAIPYVAVVTGLVQHQWPVSAQRLKKNEIQRPIFALPREHLVLIVVGGLGGIPTFDCYMRGD